MGFFSKIACFFGKHDWDYFRKDRTMVRLGKPSDKMTIPSVRHRTCLNCPQTQMKSISTMRKGQYTPTWVDTQYNRNDPPKVESEPEKLEEDLSESKAEETHTMFIIGEPEFYRCYLDVSRIEAIKRYANSRNMLHSTVLKEMTIRSSEFKDEFIASEVLFLDE